MFNIPVTIPERWVTAPINQALARFGMGLDLGRIQFFPQSLEVRVEEPVLSRFDRKSGKMMGTGAAKNLSISLRDPVGLLTGSGPLVRYVELKDVGRIALEVNPQGQFSLVGVGESNQTTETLVNAEVATAPPKPRRPFDPTNIPVSHMAIRNVSVMIKNQMTTGPLAALPSLIQIYELEANMIEPGVVVYTGHLEAQAPGQVFSNTVFGHSRDGLRFRVVARRALPHRWTLEWDGPYEAQVGGGKSFVVRGLSGDGSLELGGGRLAGNGRIRLDKLQWDDGETSISDRDISLTWNGGATSTSAQLAELVLDSHQVTFLARGSWNRGSPPTGEVVLSRAAGPILTAVQALLPGHIHAEWPAEGLYARIASDGSQGMGDPFPHLEGQVTWSSITLQSLGSYRDSVVLAGNMDITERGLTVTQWSASTTDGLQATGRIHVPNPIHARGNRDATAEIEFEGPAQGLVQRISATTDVLAKRIQDLEVDATKEVRFRANLSQALLPLDPQMFSWKHYGEMLPAPKLDSLLEIEPVRFREPRYGKLLEAGLMTSATQNRIELVYLDATTRSRSVRLEGQLNLGDEALKPVVKNRREGLRDGSLSFQFDQTLLQELLPSASWEKLQAHDIRFGARLVGETAHLGRLIGSAGLPDLRLFVSDGRFLLPTGLPDVAKVPISGITLDAVVRGASLTINRLAVPFGPGRSQLTARGSWNPGRLSLIAGMEGNLADIKAVAPKVFRQFTDFSGKVSSQGVTFDMVGLQPSDSRSKPLDYWRAAAAQVGPSLVQSWKSGRVTINGAARIDGGSLKHMVFPPAKRILKNQSVAAAGFTAISGALRIQKSGNSPVVLSAIEGFRATPTGSPSSSVTGQIALRQTELPELNLTLRVPGKVNLDPWVFGWGTSAESRAASSRPMIMSGKRFDLGLRLEAEASRFQGTDSGALNGDLGFNFVARPGASRNLIIRQLKVTDAKPGRGLKPGKALVDAQLEFKPGNVPGWPRWEAQVSLDPAFPVPQLYGWIGASNSLSRSTVVQGSAKGSGRTFEPGAINARGRITINGLSPTESPILGALIAQTRLIGTSNTFGGDRPVDFRVKNGQAEFRDLQLTQGYVRLRGQGVYQFAQPNGPLLPDGELDAIFRIEAIGTVVRQIPILSRIPIISRIIREGDQVISQLVLQFRVTGSPTKPVVRGDVGSSMLHPINTLENVGVNVSRELRRGGQDVPQIFKKFVLWVIDRMSPPMVHQWRRDGLRVLTPDQVNKQVRIPGFVAPLPQGDLGESSASGKKSDR